jgi:alpha-L-fucosidase
MNKKIVTSIFMAMVLTTPLKILPITENAAKYYPVKDPLVKAKLTRWQDLKFGLLMHWGPYSQWGIVESWSICAEDEDWCRRNIPDYTAYKKKYKALKKTFNPNLFNPQKWALAAKKAGMRYVVFTTKHHDGFCMFDTTTTDYKITDPGCSFSSHPRANITREIFQAFREQDFMVGAYFSKPDWNCPYYWWPNFATPDRNANYNIKKYPRRWQQFVRFTHTQVEELMRNYGPIDILWLDGGWVRPLSEIEIKQYINSPNYTFSRIQSQDINMSKLAATARQHQPGLIIVDRAVPGPYQNYLTPENRIPRERLPYPWESCIIMGTSWSHVANETYKPAKKLIHMLIEIVAKGGNMLLNIGPAPDGTWDRDAYRRLEEMGDWMSVNQEAIYGSRAVKPYKKGHICYTRGKGGALFAIYLAEKDESKPPATLDIPFAPSTMVATIDMLGTAVKPLWQRRGPILRITLPRSLADHPPCKYAWVFRITEK